VKDMPDNSHMTLVTEVKSCALLDYEDTVLFTNINDSWYVVTWCDSYCGTGWTEQGEHESLILQQLEQHGFSNEQCVHVLLKLGMAVPDSLK